MTMFSVTPIASSVTKVSSIESGTARLTRVALRAPMKKKSTAMTRTNAVMMLLTKSSIIWRMRTLWSCSSLISVPVGASLPRSSTMAFTASTTSTMLAPVRLVMFRLTAVRPLMRA